MKKLAAAVILCVIAFCAGSAVLRAGYLPRPDMESVLNGGFAEATESLLSANLPGSEKLASIAADLKYVSGQREFDGVFIADDGSLIRNMEEPKSGAVAGAVNSITKFVEGHGQRTYLMLLPTAAVIKQQEIPSYAADNLYNQRHSFLWRCSFLFVQRERGGYTTGGKTYVIMEMPDLWLHLQ